VRDHTEWLVTFETPAFLGNVEQEGQWRTPPFKALLREWWRISRAREFDYDHRALRMAETELFGTAADAPGRPSGKSKVRLRLSSWDKAVFGAVQATFARSQQVNTGRHIVSAGIYLGYGPVQQGASRKAIMPGDAAVALAVAVEDAQGNGATSLDDVIQLANWFGTLGSRARNGWGSVTLKPNQGTVGQNHHDAAQMSLTSAALQRMLVLRNWKDCLQLDWPHAIGMDDERRPLVWQTSPKNSWEETMHELAEIRIAVDTLVDPRRETGEPKSRHLMSYPVTHFAVGNWGNRERIPNQLRFKVIHTGNQFVGRIVHLPCRVSDRLLRSVNSNARANTVQEINVWAQVHRQLDGMAPRLVRIS
jgi:CRISPR-associated protein Cmr1